MRRGLNLRHPACKTGATTTELRTGVPHLTRDTPQGRTEVGAKLSAGSQIGHPKSYDGKTTPRKYHGFTTLSEAASGAYRANHTTPESRTESGSLDFYHTRLYKLPNGHLVISGLGVKNPAPNSPSWVRSSNLGVNSTLLCQLSYRGIVAGGGEPHTHHPYSFTYIKLFGPACERCCAPCDLPEGNSQERT